jgi:hypothetical protein
MVLVLENNFFLFWVLKIRPNCGPILLTWTRIDNQLFLKKNMYLGFVEHVYRIMNLVLGVVVLKKKLDSSFKNLQFVS